VVHPLHPSGSPTAEVTPGSSAARREASKRGTPQALACAAHRWRFTPVGAETTGAWGPEGQKLVRALVRLQSMRCGEAFTVVAARVWRRLSTAVAKGAAQMLLLAFTGPVESRP